MNKQLKFQGCAVAKPNRCTYYFEILNNRNDGINSWKAGTYYSAGWMNAWYGGQSRLSYNSDRIWCQGPQGGVKIVKDRITYPGSTYGYVTKNEKLMKEFMWIKLKAKELRF
jgi:hypothetical protein